MTTAHLLEPTATLPVDTEPAIAHPSLRASFREPPRASGFIDAAWWPRSLELRTELPPLLDVLWSAAREITHITFNLLAWDPAPRLLRLQGRTVRLGGFTTSDPLTVRLMDAWGRERIDILVIAPETDPAVAQRALLLASQTESPYRAGEILAGATTPAGEHHTTR